MKTILALTLSVLLCAAIYAQPGKKPKQENTAPSQADINKMMEDAMKAENMTPEEKEQMKKMMKDIMPSMDATNAKFADYSEFKNNSVLVPKKDAARISSISKKIPTQSDIAAYAGNLYAKLMAKGNAAETAIAKQVLAKTNNAADIHSASVLAMLQGHPEAAMALAMKAVQLNPANTNYQNSMAALLTQYGYPEQAIPVLEKLRRQYPGNSTVLNNMAHAWLTLGETDSVKKFAGLAMRANPSHPDSKLCGGLMEELKGDPIKAGNEYEDAMQNAPSPFTESMMQNIGKPIGATKSDWEKIRRSITIYEYFPREWIKTSVLTPNISSYVHNESLQSGYRKTSEQFKEKIEAMIDESGRDLQNLADKGEDVFVKEMGKEMISGFNFMSKPAVIVMRILHQYGAELTINTSHEIIELEKKIGEFRKEYDKAVKNATKCQTYEAAANKLMQNVNPMVYKFYHEKAEEYRQWLNALATWNWYLVGNPKNFVITTDLSYTAVLEGLYTSAMTGQLALEPTCGTAKTIAPADLPAHVIPNFTCPAVVSIPVGPGWQQLAASSGDFNKNGYNMQKAGSSPIPNVSIGFGVGNMIAQPGIASFVKTANGSITPGNISTDDELTPLSKIEKDYSLTPLPNIPKDEMTPLPDLSKSRYAKKLLSKMMSTDCKEVRNSKDILKEQLEKMMKSVKELDAYEETKEEIKEFGDAVEKMEADMEKKEQVKKEIEKFQKAVDEADKYEDVQTLRKKLEDFHKAAEAMENDKGTKAETMGKYEKMKQLIDEMESAPAALQDIKQNGIQPSISSSVQAPGTFTPQKDLFK